MTTPSYSTKKRLVVIFFSVTIIVLVLVIRLGFWQIVRGEDLKKEALEQWTKGIEIKAKRGVIYDKNGKKLAMSISAYTVWARPADIKEPEKTAKLVADILNLDEKTVYDKITKNQRTEKIKQWISNDEATKLRQSLVKDKITGIEIIDDNKRYYPYGNFASYILGFTNIDNDGLYGIEKTYDKFLKGTPGKWVKTTDVAGRQLPFGGEKIFDAKDGLSVVLTIDETIQHFAEKAATEALVQNKAKNVSVIIMEPKTGDILAMATKPDYDPNEPREPLNEEEKKEWDNLSQEELQKKWYDMWRNFSINDAYEPGSTFKIITSAIALEENVVTPDTPFYCNGFIRDIPGVVLKCSRWYNPHGAQTFAEGVRNSCNVVFVNVGRKIGKEKMLEYIKAFGFGENTGVDLTGEQAGIIPKSVSSIKEVNLATISYGQGIAVTPMQLITAISSVANGGNLMKPRIVKELVDDKGNVQQEIKPEVKRKVLSEETCKTLLGILESVVSEGTGKSAYIPGYRIGGKTGTAQKVIDGKYAPGKYIASFAAIAPTDDPKIAVLFIIDEPSNGAYYGGVVAAPIAGELVEETLKYLGVEPKYSEKEKEELSTKVVVPDVTNKTISEAGKILSNLGFKYNTEVAEVTENSVVIDQFPLPGTEVTKGSIIDIYLKEKRKDNEAMIMIDLKGKSRDEAVKELDELNLKYRFTGNGIVKDQKPKAGEEINSDTVVEVELSEIKE